MNLQLEQKVIELIQSGEFIPAHLLRVICGVIPCNKCQLEDKCNGEYVDISSEKFYGEFMNKYPEYKI